MKPTHPLTTAAPTSFIRTLLLFLHLTTSFPSNVTGNFPNCSQTFSCGTLANITYPFTGGQRPSHCGPPEFHLTCFGDSLTTLTANSLTYRVTQLNQTNQTLRLSRVDFYDDSPCTHQLKNTTLDDRIFSLGSDHENVSLFYGCEKLNDHVKESGLNLTNKFSCDVQRDSKEGFFWVNPAVVGGDSFWNAFECKIIIQVPILKTQANQLLDNGSLIGEVLKDGFNVSYSNPYSTDCQKCYKHSGSHCGFDVQSGKPICICNDQLCPEKSSDRKPLTIGLSAASAVVLGIFMGCWIFVITRRESSSTCISVNFRLKNLQHVDRLETFMMDYHSLTPKRYSYSDTKKITNSFTKVLGQGGFGDVYKGKLPDGRLVAVKVLKESKDDGEEFINEVASISRTSHVNIVTLLGFCYERTKRALIYEFMPKGSLDKFISYKGSLLTKGRLEWKKINEISVGTARGLEYLHRGCNTRIVHFDIKPHNILLDEDFCPKISDFGLAKLCKSKVSKISMIGARGTVGYIAPEVFCRNFGGVTYKSDVYSYGMMVLEMVGERKDFDIGSLETSETYFPDWFYKHLEPGEISRVHESITEDEEEIVKKMIIVGLWCIQTSPSNRPSMTKVVEMLEGSLEFLQIPPRPFLSSPKRSHKEESSAKSFPSCLSLQSDEQQKSPLNEGEL